MRVASSASGHATCEGLFNACSFRSCSQLPATREFFTIGRKVYESEHKAGETAVCWSQKHQAPFWAKEPGSYMGVSATTNVSGRKTMASTVGAESGDQRKTVVILSDRSREISACSKNYSASAARLNRAQVAVQRSRRGPTPNSAPSAKTNILRPRAAA